MKVCLKFSTSHCFYIKKWFHIVMDNHHFTPHKILGKKTSGNTQIVSVFKKSF
jgi:hypothetical protein